MIFIMLILGNGMEISGESNRGLRGYWRLNGHTFDSSGGEAHGTPIGNLTYAPVMLGQGVNLLSPGDFVSIANDNGELTVRDAMTIEAWILGRDIESGNHKIVDNPGSYTLRITNGNIAFDCVDKWEPGGAALKKDLWYHVAVSYDGAHKRLFINGELINVKSVTGPIPKGTGNAVTIGSPSDPFIGTVDEVKIYDCALDPVEIFSSYLEGKALAGYWAFEEDTNDESGWGHDGILYGGGKYTAGKRGKALTLSNSGYVKIPGDDQQLNLSRELTLEAWICGSDFKGNYHHVFDNFGSYTVSVYNGNLAFFDNGWFTPGDERSQLKTGQWYHVACTFDGKKKKIYLDGKLKASIEVKGESGDSEYGMITIGSDRYPFSGTIDEVKIYRLALPEHVILLHYNQHNQLHNEGK